ncbi:MAG TPA: GDSL-type esterase/lipase family protein [Ktedonobacteraceae bacterium]|nr:GDSL-type esterase/lipase family protein [Ktedonobacteraceae bacterium]
MQGQFSAPSSRKRLATRLASKRSWLLLLIALAVLLSGSLFVSNRAFADTATPGQPTSINGSSGAQQASLSWGAASNATGYLVNETDLVTGQTTQLSTLVTSTSTTVTGLQVGHWYRFTITGVAGTVQGPASNPIEIRTTGFSGSYDTYYALGDSYSAGDGAPPYFGASGCYRSTNVYSYRLGNGAPTPDLIACSGAVTADIDQKTQSSSVPGTQLSQLLSGSRGNTLITITIGGNDIGFSSELTKCITSFSSCKSDQSTIAAKITALEPRLVQVYKELRSAAPGADIIIVGYPLLVANPSIADCHNLVVYYGLGAGEMTMIRTLATQLDNVIAQAAAQAGVSNAAQQVAQAFAGHEACTKSESQEWINEIAGLNDALHDSFHPNSAGYQAIAGAVDSERTSLYQSGMVRD